MVNSGCSKKNSYCSIMFAVAEGKEIEEKISNCYVLGMSMPKQGKNTNGGDFDILQLPHGQDFDTWNCPRVGIMTIDLSKFQKSPG